MRLGVWYLSMGVMGLVGLFFAIAIVRLIFYIITILVASPGIWIFPNLFADVGFVRTRDLIFCPSAHEVILTRSIRLYHCGSGIYPRRRPRRSGAKSQTRRARGKRQMPTENQVHQPLQRSLTRPLHPAHRVGHHASRRCPMKNRNVWTSAASNALWWSGCDDLQKII